jgi:hypothetical protein
MMINEAQRLVHEGYVIFPIRANMKIGDPYKGIQYTRPPAKWQTRTTSDMTEDYIERNFSHDENAYAVCGLPFKDGYLVVLDVDKKDGKDGTSALQKLFDGHLDALKTTRMQVSISGGQHYFFLSRSNALKSTTNFGAQDSGLDIRAQAGCIALAPSSVIIKGEMKTYTVAQDMPVQFLPDEVEQRLLPQKVEVVKKEPYMRPVDPRGVLHALSELAAEGRFDDYDEWVHLGMALKHGGYTVEDWLALSHRTEDPQLVDEKWRSFDEVDGGYTEASIYFWAQEKGFSPWKQVPEKPEGRTFIRNFYRCSAIKVDENEKESEVFEAKPYLTFNDSPAFLLPTKRFYTFRDADGKKYLILRKDSDIFIKTTSEFYAKLHEEQLYLDFKPKGPLTESKYLAYILEKCEQVRRFTLLPELDSQPGTLYVGEAGLVPRKTGAFREMLDLFTVQTARDRYRIAAGFLSMFLNSTFDGKRPLFTILAATKGSGKSSVVQEGFEILEGEPTSLIVKLGDSTAEKIGGVKSMAKRGLLIDNIQYVNVKDLVDLTISVTSPTMKAWGMYLSHANVSNNKTWWATLNDDSSFNDDILQRIITIRMKRADEISNDERQHVTHGLNDLKTRRREVLEDVLWILEASKSVDYSTIILKPHRRFTFWSQEMVKLLAVVFPEETDFDFELSEEDEELSSDIMMIREFFESIGPHSSFVTIEEMFNLFTAYFGERFYASKTKSSCTRYLKNNIASVKNYDVAYTSRSINGHTMRGWSITPKNVASESTSEDITTRKINELEGKPNLSKGEENLLKLLKAAVR